MKLSVTPSYEEIFRREPPELNALISDIPSKVIIGFLSAINAELAKENDDDATQRKIFLLWSHHFTESQKMAIQYGVQALPNRGNNTIMFFAQWYVTEFIQHTLINYSDFPFEGITPQQEYNMFLAYLVIIGKLNKEYQKVLDSKMGDVRSEFKFQEATWPMLAAQFDFNHVVDPMYQSIKSFSLLDFLASDSRTSKYHESFLNVVGRKNTWDYIFSLIDVVKIGLEDNQSIKFSNFSIASTPEFEPMLDFFAINIPEFIADSTKQVNYLGMREKPLFKIKEKTYFVMNWNFLYNQVNRGLEFDFYNRSGVAKEFKQRPDFNKIIGESVSEKILFRGIVKKALGKRHAKLYFDDKNETGFPDCYYREGKNIFLFEFKDSRMPNAIIASANFEKIKAEIDKKFVLSDKGKNKGVMQLYNHIVKLNENKFNVDDFEKEGIKRRNIIIYPVIVYMDYMYSMPGVNGYLNSVLNNELKKYSESKTVEVQQVKKLIMINFEFFFRNFLGFKNGDYKIKDLFDSYIKLIKKREEKAKLTPNSDTFLSVNTCFEELSNVILAKSRREKHKDYVTELFDALGINDVSLQR